MENYRHSPFGTRRRAQSLRLSAFGFRPSDLPKALLTLVAILAFAPWGRAPPSPHIGYVYPAGGRQGAVFQVAVGGQYLNNAANAYVSGDGVQVVVVDYSRPLTQKEFNDLREKLKELQDRRAAATASAKKRDGPASSQPGTNVVWTAADDRIIAE